jgi:hypothetical protein
MEEPLANIERNECMRQAAEREERQCMSNLEARAAFVSEYCRAKGWPEDPDALTMQQVYEIRAQDGWKNAGPLNVVFVELDPRKVPEK